MTDNDSAEAQQWSPMTIDTAKGNIIPARGVVEQNGNIKRVAEIPPTRQRNFEGTSCKSRI